MIIEFTKEVPILLNVTNDVHVQTRKFIELVLITFFVPQSRFFVNHVHNLLLPHNRCFFLTIAAAPVVTHTSRTRIRSGVTIEHTYNYFAWAFHRIPGVNEIGEMENRYRVEATKGCDYLMLCMRSHADGGLESEIAIVIEMEDWAKRI
ncbi:unnamed protein product [Lactuca virosa]|uniref:Uncharacterized protein n=1 Tax=Lactuca virosa TaxID=75947 RepID=A0AAU9LX68_9ASTR|nr:unnamed protein product [Lactuca virosa]